MPDNPAPPPTVPTPAPAPAPNEAQARTWNMWCHLSALAGYVGVPFGSVLGPLVVWQMKKNELPSVEAHGKAALNFQITVLIATLVTVILAIVLAPVFCIGFALIPIAIIVGLCGPVFAIVAGLKANDGKDYTYPYSLKLIK